MPANSWRTGFYAALLKYVQEHGYPNASEVTGLYDSYYFSGCATCGDDIEVEIYFKTADSDHSQTYIYDGSSTHLIAALSD